MTEQTRAQGPASYFPMIEQRYGKPIDHWLGLLAGLGECRHSGMVAWLKAEHGMGHGHANALAAFHRART
jgi:hypothetical protein